MKRLALLSLLTLAACTPAAAYVGQQPTTPAVTRDAFTPVARYQQATATLAVDDSLIAAEQAGMVAIWIAEGRPCAAGGHDTGEGCPTVLPEASEATTEPTEPAYVAPTEDSPGWNCDTQGNRVCGPDPAIGRQSWRVDGVNVDPETGRCTALIRSGFTDATCTPTNAIGTALSCTAEGCVER